LLSPFRLGLGRVSLRRHFWDAIAVENPIDFVIPFEVGIRVGFICRGGFRDKLNPQTNNLSAKPALPHLSLPRHFWRAIAVENPIGVVIPFQVRIRAGFVVEFEVGFLI